ncbi:MAG: tetratricopeptide repeat protein [Candidatus Cloacimonadales bacterium]|nr:tetratricopeptide repeat protein [Candidatus Cloacimonadota bacterium]MDD2650912.1 tetratricopeptide repeat protein [Candidatus Cloacimonadota bacterium]MDD3500947.1 tetratricopeptide repeat protein [Candidatus Cloacimonadota bacterium]MDX9977196.1 tetratricopeptide repeat protein [Candidatus Cloacimonadales bacterium]
MKTRKAFLILSVMMMVVVGLFAQQEEMIDGGLGEQTEEAVVVYEKSLERIASEFATAGDSLFTINKYDEAFYEYEKAFNTYKEAVTDITPFDEELKRIANNLYITATNAKMYDKAVLWGEKFLEYEPNNEAVVKNVSTIYAVGLKNNKKAVDIWVNYESKFKTNTAKLAIADRYARTKEYESAIEWYRYAYEQSGDADIFEKIADLYIKLKKNAEALKTYEDFLASNPSEADLFKTYKNLSSLYNKLKDVDNSIVYAEKALEIKNDNQLALFLTSKYYEKKDYNKTITYSNIVISNTPNNFDAIYFRALAYYYSNNKSAAKDDFEQLVGNAKYGPSATQFLEYINKGR